MKKVLIVPGNTFVSRNYFSSPMIENLKRISMKDNIKIIVAEIESNPVPNETFDKLKKIIPGIDMTKIRLVFQEFNNLKITEVTSPTFNLLNEYQLKKIKINHYDLFRIKSIEEIKLKRLKKIISSKISLRHTPRLRFSIDETFEQAKKINDILGKIKK